MKKSGKIIAFVLTFTLLLTFQPLTEAIKAVADVVASNKTKSDGDITSDIYGDVDGTVLTKTLEEAFEEGYQKRLKEENVASYLESAKFGLINQIVDYVDHTISVHMERLTYPHCPESYCILTPHLEASNFK